MGFFHHAFNWVKSKAKKHLNWSNLKEKAKKGWNIGTMILGKARTFAGKAKKVVAMANLIPGLQEYTEPLLAGLTTAEATLGTIDKLRQGAESAFSSKRTSPKKNNYIKSMSTPGVVPTAIVPGVTSGSGLKMSGIFA